MTTANDSMTIQLPTQLNFQQCCRLENGWSDHYGAILLALAHAGLSCPPNHSLHGVWQHGCFGPWQNLSAEALCYSAPNARQMTVGVARADQAELLAAKGYARVRAMGLPMVYTPEVNVARIPGSLLVVPTHTLTGDQFPDRSPFERYADEIQTVAGRFSRVVICVHPNCRRNGLWVDEFSSRGFEIVFGAQTNDANALLRMRMLFEQFESVTTNGWGSHVAYALAFGARVSIHGALPQRTEADYLKDLSWAANPAGLKAMLSGETLAREREYLQAFFLPPEHGVADIAKGRWLIGADHKLAPAEMQQVLAAMIPHLLEYQEVHRTREQRRVVRQEAARLVQARRKPEALKLLLNFVQQAAASKQALFILETLHEVSEDLKTLDPVRSALLQEQAQLLTARIETARRTAA